jgi:RpiR family carbohydrate utilization transcriptional regulator
MELNSTDQRRLAERNVSAAVLAAMPSLQPSDARVARLFLDQPEVVIHQSVSEVAASASASTATVVRCAQKLGFKGFHDLKLALVQELAAVGSQQHLGDVEAGDDPLRILTKVAQAGAQTIVDAAATVSPEALSAAVQLLGEAETVLFIGVGTSAPLAQDAAYRFKTIGVRAEFPSDAHIQHVAAKLLKPTDLCFAISHSGSTRETLSAVSAAKDAGAGTVAVTSFAASPLTELVDHAIVAGAREVSFRLEAMGSRLAHMAVLDALVAAVALSDEKRAAAALELYTDALSEHRL